LRKEVRSQSAPAPAGPYSQAVDASAVYCAGQLGTDPSTGQLEVGVIAQTRRALQNLDEVLKAAGLGLKDVVKTTVFLADMSEYPKMNEEYAKHFSPPYPARTTVQAAALPKGARVEIDATAVR
jgi:2-iminobutanoate/2-iminopropanoate deaminase